MIFYLCCYYFNIFWFPDRLDGLGKRRKAEGKPQTLEDWLQLTDDYDRRKTTPGKKMVRLSTIITTNVSSLALDTVCYTGGVIQECVLSH
jgi:hypothetical protein